MAPVIPLRRIKTVILDGLAARFGAIEKSPPKVLELRLARPLGRIAAKQLDALTGIQPAKFVHRARRHAKLHLFRMWKLFGELKAQPGASGFRPVAERVRVARWMLRL
jgi:hypothetical protein